jgi:hypothetical protein
VGHHQVGTRISEKTHILQFGHQEWGNKISFYNVLGRCVAIYTRCGNCDGYDFVVSSVGSSTRGLESSLKIALESVGRSVRVWVGFIGDWYGEDSWVCEVIVLERMGRCLVCY